MLSATNQESEQVVSSFKEVTHVFKQITGYPPLFFLIIMGIYISCLLNLFISYSICILLWSVSYHLSYSRSFLSSYHGTGVNTFSALSLANYDIILVLHCHLFVV